MKNIKEKLANARTLCPGMSKDFYILTDYMSENCNDELVPIGMLVMIVCILDDFEKGRCGWAGSEFSEELAKRKDFIKDEIKWIPQLIDAIADEEFAQEFRREWKKIFGFIPPKRVKNQVIETEEQYPEYVKVAVDWWANAILAPKFDNGVALPGFLSFSIGATAKEYSEEEIKLFKDVLAKGIIEEMNKWKCSNINVDYHPCRILAVAGKLIGVDDMFGYPCKTDMRISKEEVSVSAGYGATWDTIWSAGD